MVVQSTETKVYEMSPSNKNFFYIKHTFTFIVLGEIIWTARWSSISSKINIPSIKGQCLDVNLNFI